MRIVTWNIRSGGNARTLPALLEEQPDLVVLTEYRRKLEAHLRAGLEVSGLPSILTSESAEKDNAVLLASRGPLELLRGTGPEWDSQRWLEARDTETGLHVLAIHIPGAPDNKFGADGVGVSGLERKRRFWLAVLEWARAHAGDQAIIVGDFNTGLPADAEGAPFRLSENLRDLLAVGFVDAWRDQNPQARDFTWWSRAKRDGVTRDYNGFRLDYVFVSPPLARDIRSAQLQHAPRTAGISDHSMVVVDLDAKLGSTPPSAQRVPVAAAAPAGVGETPVRSAVTASIPTASVSPPPSPRRTGPRFEHGRFKTGGRVHAGVLSDGLLLVVAEQAKGWGYGATEDETGRTYIKFSYATGTAALSQWAQRNRITIDLAQLRRIEASLP